ncbi:MAG: bifunctional phosphoribosylaminoimidazolecarboxamide formyltransferase/IMP cyclohydrolase [Phycisphaerales bacterium]|nr:bifunctional phosphoribosylaminoimidazolecarboxamide formyltransferase/IMP cyclohydrolase [Phycisphaerales bacterium]
MANDVVAVKRALISVSDKAGIVEFAIALQREFGVELVSTGGTAKALGEAGLKVRDVSEVTGFAEMMSGRVKTLHPLIHGGLLALRDDPEHVAAMQQHHIPPIDMLVVNLYPFEQTVAKPDCTFEHAIENIDIGGPAMIRSAGKNHRSVALVTDAGQYQQTLDELRLHGGGTTYDFRRAMATRAFARTAAYDAAIHAYLRNVSGEAKVNSAQAAGTTLPAQIDLSLKKSQSLRYGENPHQAAGLYVNEAMRGGIAAARQLHGKELSYINLLDADAAWSLVREFDRPAVAVIKHANPCGCAAADTIAEAFDAAYAGDPVAAFGGIVALNRNVNQATAERIASGKRFLEVLLAPGFEADALALLKGRWADCRILALPADGVSDQTLKMHSIMGGVLMQASDAAGFDRMTARVVSQRQPTQREWVDMAFAWLVVKHVKSNAISVAASEQLLASGAGQMSRVTSCRLAVELAAQNGHKERLAGAVAASDAFFPFSDGPAILLDAGITAIIQPGGSKRDQDTIDLCNERGAALVLTGQRHFLH